MMVPLPPAAAAPARAGMSCASRYIFRMLAIGLLAVTAGLAALVWVTQSVRFIQLVLERGLSLAVFFELPP